MITIDSNILTLSEATRQKILICRDYVEDVIEFPTQPAFLK